RVAQLVLGIAQGPYDVLLEPRRHLERRRHRTHLQAPRIVYQRLAGRRLGRGVAGDRRGKSRAAAQKGTAIEQSVVCNHHRLHPFFTGTISTHRCLPWVVATYDIMLAAGTMQEAPGAPRVVTRAAYDATQIQRWFTLVFQAILAQQQREGREGISEVGVTFALFALKLGGVTRCSSVLLEARPA